MKEGANLYLVGPMGVGKTTIGRLVAQRLGRPFVDLDEEIEARAGADIPWIFDVEGEEGFRRREAALLAEVAQKRGWVVATGGGVVLRADNRRLMRQSGVVVFLDASVEQLYRRTRRDRRRPLLQVPDRRAALRALKEVRDPLYREAAHLVLPVDGLSSRRVTELLLEALAGLD
ncbi:MAG: shikimate kinase [Porticoccaceae bacterium]|nr:MAG: shikimate kinase [Porticoccaceae bacterium]